MKSIASKISLEGNKCFHTFKGKIMSYSNDKRHFLKRILFSVLGQFFTQSLCHRRLIFNGIQEKSLTEALIFASTNPQYEDRLFIEHENSKLKIC